MIQPCFCGIRLALLLPPLSGSAQISVSDTFGATQAYTIFRVQAPTRNSPSVTVRRHPPRRLQRFKHYALPTVYTDILVLSLQHLVLLASFPHLRLHPHRRSSTPPRARIHASTHDQPIPLPRLKIEMSTHSIRSLVVSRAPHDQPLPRLKIEMSTHSIRGSVSRAHTYTHTRATDADSLRLRQADQTGSLVLP